MKILAMRNMIIVLVLIIFQSFVVSAFATAEIYPFVDPAQQQQFNDLIKQMRCLVCQNEDLADSNADLAKDLRQQIYTRVRAGQSDQAIQNYLVQRYGDFILLKPPLVARTYVLWFAPVGLLLIGLLILWRIGKAARPKNLIIRE